MVSLFEFNKKIFHTNPVLPRTQPNKVLAKYVSVVQMCLIRIIKINYQTHSTRTTNFIFEQILLFTYLEINFVNVTSKRIEFFSTSVLFYILYKLENEPNTRKLDYGFEGTSKQAKKIKVKELFTLVPTYLPAKIRENFSPRLQIYKHICFGFSLVSGHTVARVIYCTALDHLWLEQWYNFRIIRIPSWHFPTYFFIKKSLYSP